MRGVVQRIIGAAALVLVVFGAATTPVHAAAPFVLPALTQVGPDVADPARSTSAAVNAGGTAVVAWSRFPNREPGTPERQTATVAFRSPAGVWSAPQYLSTPGKDASEVRVAIDAAGVATVAWTETETGVDQDVHVVRVTPAGELDRQVLSPVKGGARELQLAVNASGAAVLAWNGFTTCSNRFDGCGDFPGNGNIFVASRADGTSRFAAAEQLSGDTVVYRAGLSASIGASGDVAVAWQEDPPAALHLKVRQRPAGGTFGAARELTATGAYSVSAATGVAPNGSALVTWWERGTMRATPFSASGEPGPTQTLPGTYRDRFSFGPAALGTDAAGRTTAAWVANDGLWVATSDASGTFGGGTVLDAYATASDPATPALAVQPDGGVLLAWNSDKGLNASWRPAAEPEFRAPLSFGSVGWPFAVALANGHAVVAAWAFQRQTVTQLQSARLLVSAGDPAALQQAAGATPGAGGASSADTVAPTLRILRAGVVKTKPKATRTRTRGKTRRTLQVVVSASEPAQISLTLTARRPGARRGKACVAPTARTRRAKARSCIRTVAIGTPMKWNVPAGESTLSMGTAPPRGRYDVVAGATDLSGNAATPVSRRLVVR